MERYNRRSATQHLKWRLQSKRGGWHLFADAIGGASYLAKANNSGYRPATIKDLAWLR